MGTDHDRFARILEEYGESGYHLQARNLDELFEKAREVKMDVVADVDLHPDGREVPPWLLSV